MNCVLLPVVVSHYGSKLRKAIHVRLMLSPRLSISPTRPNERRKEKQNSLTSRTHPAMQIWPSLASHRVRHIYDPEAPRK